MSMFLKLWHLSISISPTFTAGGTVNSTLKQQVVGVAAITFT